MEIKELCRQHYDYYELHYTYTSDECYSCCVVDSEKSMNMSFERYKLNDTYFHDSYDTLFQDTWFEPSAYGLFVEGVDKPVAILEVDRELWNSRLRITQLLVLQEYRNKGYGRILIQKAKEIAQVEDFRMIVLETQSCNVNAIDFYRKMGFKFCGGNVYFYSNDDIGENEVMLEMAYLF